MAESSAGHGQQRDSGDEPAIRTHPVPRFLHLVRIDKTEFLYWERAAALKKAEGVPGAELAQITVH